jgi:hypothetical protein
MTTIHTTRLILNKQVNMIQLFNNHEHAKNINATINGHVYYGTSLNPTFTNTYMFAQNNNVKNNGQFYSET